MTVTILDGGMGRELHRRGAPFRQPEWSALALMEAPDIVRETHLDFLRAGAQVITSKPSTWLLSIKTFFAQAHR